MNVKRNAVVALLFAAAACTRAFAADTTPPTVTDVRAYDGLGGEMALPGTVDFAIDRIVVTFSEDMDPATVSVETFRLVRSGGDGTFDSGNETEVVLASVTAAAGVCTVVPLQGGMLNDVCRLSILGSAIPDAGLAGHWPCDEGSGVSVADSSGRNSDGTFYGATWTSGVAGAALSFDGTGGYIDVDPPGALTGTFTVAAWAKVDDLAGDRCVISTRDPFEYGFDFKFADGAGLHGVIGNGSSWITTLADAPLDCEVGRWYHVVYVVTSISYQILVDGVTVGGAWYGANAPVLYGDRHDIRIGQSGAGEFFHGAIDEVCVYDRALTQAEVQRLVVRAYIADVAGNALDGEYGGSLPSGDGQPGGDFVCTFTAEDLAAPEPVTELRLSPRNEEVEVAWRNPLDADLVGVLVLRRIDAAPTGSPMDGAAYGVGEAIGDGFVIYSGLGTDPVPGDRSDWTDTGLLNGTEYHYAVFAYDASLNYSPGSTASGTPSEDGDKDGLCGAGGASPLSLLGLFALLALAFGRLRRASR